MSNIANLGNFPHTIGNLDDRPNLTAAQMKAALEQDVMTLWVKLAEAIPYINDILPASKLVDIVNSSSTDNGVPTAKAVYDAIADASLGGSAQQIIDDWLDAHPEATTTVTDGSITNAKLATSFVTPGVAAAYVPNTAYPAGSYVFKDGVLYTNPEDVSDSVWTAAHWIETNVCIDIHRYKKKVDSLVSLFYPDVDEYTDGYCINGNNGELLSVSDCVASDYISVIQGSECFFKYASITTFSGDVRGFAFYDHNKEFVSGKQYPSGSDHLSVTVPSNAYYMRLTVQKTYIDKFLFCVDMSPAVFQLFNSCRNGYSYTVQSGTYINHNTGEETSLIDGYSTPYLSVESGSYLLINAYLVSAAGCAFYDSNKSYVCGVSSSYPTIADDLRLVPVPDGVKFIRVSSLGSTPAVSVSKANNALYDMITNQAENNYSPSLFPTICVCGDSYTAAQFWTKEGVLKGDNEAISWGKILGRIYGVDVSVCASSGANTSLWQTRESCLPKLLSEPAKDLYIFSLAINDATTVALGTIDDIHNDYTANPNTYYGNFGRIIDQVKAHAPDARIILSKCWLVNSAYYTYCSTAIDEIATHYGIAVIDTAEDAFFRSASYAAQMYNGHPTPVQQSGMAKAMGRLITKCMTDHLPYFADTFPG